MTKKTTKPAERNSAPRKKPTPKKTATAVVQSVDEILEPKEVEEIIPASPKLFDGRERYWLRPIFVKGFGKVSGLVYEDHWKEFMKNAPQDLDPVNWVGPVDLVAKRIEEAKEKMLRKAGLK